jgi:hypothetical protein
MKIIAKNVTILKSSFNFSDDGKKFTYQANADICVEGNPFENLVTPETIFDLECLVSDMANIQSITEAQVDAFVAKKYKI